MPLILAVSGASWPASGAATAGTTGLNTITGGTHVASTDIPEGSTATGYIQGTDGGAVSVRLNLPADVFTDNETDLWITTEWYLEETGALPADTTSLQLNLVQSLGPTATRLRTFAHVRNLLHNPGFALAVSEFCTGGLSEKLHGAGSSGAPPIIPLNKIFRLTFHWRRSTSDGVYEVFFNEVLVQRQSGLPTDGEITAGQLAAQCSITWPATAGVRVRLHGGMSSWDGVGPGTRPLHGRYGSNSDISHSFSVDSTNDQTNPHGRHWARAGTATRTVAQYSGGGSSLSRNFFGYAGAGLTWSQTLIDEVGSPQYGALGYTSYFFDGLYFPDGTGQIVVRAAGGAVIKTLDIVASELKLGATVLAPWVHNANYAMAIHFGLGGECTMTLSNLTANNSTQNGWSADLGAWTPGALGTVKVSGTIVATSHRCGGLRVYRRVPCVLTDSLCHVNDSAVTPAFAMRNHIAAGLAADYDGALLPGAAYPNYPHGMACRPVGFIFGRTGQTRDVVVDNVLEPQTFSRNLDLINVDLGSINDYVQSPMTDVPEQTGILNAQQAKIERMFDLAAERKWTVWMTTMIVRPSGYVWTELQRDAMGLANVRMRAAVVAKQSASRHLRFSDVALAILDHDALFTPASDPTHPNSAGNGTIAQQMVLTMTTPPGPRINRPLGLGLGV